MNIVSVFLLMLAIQIESETDKTPCDPKQYKEIIADKESRAPVLPRPVWFDNRFVLPKLTPLSN